MYIYTLYTAEKKKKKVNFSNIPLTVINHLSI